MTKLSVKNIDKIIAMQAKDKVVFVSYKLQDGTNIEIEVKNTISIKDMNTMVENVADSLFQDGQYYPALYSYVLCRNLILYYTNIKADMSIQKFNEIMYNTNIIENIKSKINNRQYCDIVNAIDKKIEYLKSVYTEKDKQNINSLIDNIHKQEDEVYKVINNFAELGKMLSDNPEELKNAIIEMSKKDEKKIADEVFQNVFMPV